MKLFCFTFAGGTTAFFDDIKRELDVEGDIEVISHDYPGHGKRHKEALCSSINAMARDMKGIIREEYEGDEYSLFGYSMGSIVLTEILRLILEEKDMKLPVAVFLAAHTPDSMMDMSSYNDRDLDEVVKERTLRYGEVPEKLTDNPTFWRFYLPLYRADYTNIWDYDFDKPGLRTSIPAVFFYSEEDTPYEKMREWRKYYTGDTEFKKYKGKHFFIRENYKDMAGIMKGRLKESVS